MEREREREIEWGEKTTKWIAKIKKKCGIQMLNL